MPPNGWLNTVRIYKAQKLKTDRNSQNFVLQFKFSPKNRRNKALAAIVVLKPQIPSESAWCFSPC